VVDRLHLMWAIDHSAGGWWRRWSIGYLACGQV